MASYQDLQDRIDRGEVVIMDGAIGTELQRMGAPIHPVSWAGAALETHPTTVQMMHERYIKAGAEIILTNTYSSARHNLEPMGLGEKTRELNMRAVLLAQNARDRAAKDRPVYVAGVVSSFGLITGSDPVSRPRRFRWRRSAISEEDTQANLREQAEILAESEVDLIICESTEGLTLGNWVAEASSSVGLPYWVGFKVKRIPELPYLKIGENFGSDYPFTKIADARLPIGEPMVASVFHSNVTETTEALDQLKERWTGPMGAYPEAGRTDYMRPLQSPDVQNNVTVDEWVDIARGWVGDGVQIVGGCCGMGVEYIEPLRDSLPGKIPALRQIS